LYRDTHIRAGEQLKGTQQNWVKPTGHSACGECDRDGDDSSYRQASLKDAENEIHQSFPELSCLFSQIQEASLNKSTTLSKIRLESKDGSR
jgi:hypothetical protein